MKDIFFYATIFLILATSAGCGKAASEMESAAEAPANSMLVKIEKDQFERAGMKLDTVTLASFPSLVSANGVIDVPPNSRATINAYMGGYVRDFPLLVGDKVRKGQKLVSLENLEFLELQQQYLETSQRLKYLEAEFQRQRQLYEENINSQKVFMKAENEYEKTKIEHQGLRQKLRMIQIDPDGVTSESIRASTSIYSPISGSVTKVFVNAGTHVTPDNPVMEVVNSDHLHLEIQVFEKDALKIYEGQKVKFRVPEYSDRVFEAEVHVIGKTVDMDRTIKVHAHLNEDQKERFIPGMFVQAEILAEESMKPALPVGAFYGFDGRNYILRLTDETETHYVFRKIEVVKGQEKSEFIGIDLPSSVEKHRYLSGYTPIP